MSGLMEILLIVAIILGILLLPKMLSNQPKQVIQQPYPGLNLTGWNRLAIVASLLWPMLTAFYLKPWNNHWHLFFYIAAGPLIVGWGTFWVISGFRKKGK